jgi:transcriptional regulator with XRE-family HTH domain
MANAEKGPLSQYVSQIMKIKGLSARDVARRSKSADLGITAGYVSDIVTGAARNPSVDKLKALARGLDVDVDELFHVACGRSERALVCSGDDRLPLLRLLEVMQLVAVSSELTSLMEKLARLRPDKRPAVESLVDDLLQADGKSRTRRRRPKTG